MPATHRDGGGVDAGSLGAAKRKLGVVISVGDSITRGIGGGYQAYTAAQLRGAGVSLTQDIINDGHPGWQAVKCSLDGVYQIIEPDFAKWKPDTVLLMIGTNDFAVDLPGLTLASVGHPEINCGFNDVIKRVNLLVEKIHQQRPTAMVFLANIPPNLRIPQTEQASAQYAPQVAALVNRRRAEGDLLIEAVDVYTGFPTSTGLGADHTHPNEAGQQFIGTRFASAIVKWLAAD
ncbi:MAG TPA: GDSL-type esterase/lipase family protein [Polyangiales bacterium]